MVDFIVDSDGEIIPTVERNLIPPFMVNGAFNVEIAIALGLAAVAFVLVLAIERLANRHA
jgi:hypothetical protein